MIDTQAIRSKVLDLAMRGKLTEQLPEDGTAAKLYQQIQAKKQALIRDRTLKKKKPLPEFAEEEQPFDLPSNWRWVRLKEICTKIVDGDHNPPVGVQEKTEYLMLSAQNINKGKLCNLDNVRHLSAAIFEEENKRTQLEVDDVLLTIVGTIGRTCVYQGGYNICFQRSVAVITTLIDSRYLKCALDIPFVQNFMEKNATGAAQLGFYLNKLENLLIPLPPLAEQHRIVARIEQAFSALDTIDTLQAKYADNLAVLKSKLIDAAIQGKLTEQLPEDGTAEELYGQIQKEKQALVKAGKIKKEKHLPEITADEIPFDIPKSWKWARLGNLMLDVSTGPFGSMLHESDYCEGGIPLVNPMHIQNGAIHPSDKMRVSPSTLERLSQYRLSEGMIVVARRGDLGRCARIGKSENGWICGTGCFFLNPSRHVFSPFITLVISSPFARSVFRGTAIGTTMANLNHNLLKGLPFPLPPLAEQKRIVERVTKLLAVCDESKAVSKRMEQ